MTDMNIEESSSNTTNVNYNFEQETNKYLLKLKKNLIDYNTNKFARVIISRAQVKNFEFPLLRCIFRYKFDKFYQVNNKKFFFKKKMHA